MSTDTETILARLDRVIELLEDIRAARRAQQASDLYQLHVNGFMTESELRKRITAVTGLPFPEDE